MVGAPGFEPGASCAQDIKHAPAKSLRLNATLVKSAASHNSWLWLAVAGFGYLFAGSLQKSLHEYVHLKGRFGERAPDATTGCTYRKPFGWQEI